MEENIYSTATTDSLQDWFTSCSLNEENIRKQSKNILNNPVLVDNTTEERFYSECQMLEMFRIGFETVSETQTGKKIIAQLKKNDNAPYRLIRNMDIDETKVFPFESWNTVRSAAGQLKRIYGAVYRVTKLAKAGDIGDIEVKRIH